MEITRSLSFLLCLFLILISYSLKTQVPQLGKNSVSEVVAAMTPEEKGSMVVGCELYLPGINFPGMSNAEPTAGQKKVPGCTGATTGIPRLGIPALAMNVRAAGLGIINTGFNRIYYATAWPVGTLLASGGDTTLVKTAGTKPQSILLPITRKQTGCLLM
jgi:beta-glucosidase